MLDRLVGDSGTAGKHAIEARLAPSGRVTTPDDVASVVVDPRSDVPQFNTGDVLLIDAGGTTEVVMT